MKVYIGPYVDRWISRVHDRHMDIKYGFGEWDDNKDWEDCQWERFEDALQWLYNHTINLYLDRKERKVKIRIDRYDTWSMDHTLAHIILPMLKQLKETNHGSPFVDMEDVPKELRATKAQIAKAEKNGDIDDKHFDRWQWVMDEMIWAFEQKCRDDWESDYTTGEYDFQFVKVEDGEHKGYSEMVEGPNHTAVTDWDGRKKHQERMSNGFRLFGKYFENLWD
jgi:hypothetical protein